MKTKRSAGLSQDDAATLHRDADLGAMRPALESMRMKTFSAGRSP